MIYKEKYRNRTHLRTAASIFPWPRIESKHFLSYTCIVLGLYTLGAARALAPIITKPKRPCFHQLFPIFWFPSYFSDKATSDRLPMSLSSPRSSKRSSLTSSCRTSRPIPAIQSGFRKGHSTETLLLRLLSDIYGAIDPSQLTFLALFHIK